jgi:hypothetical protein
MGRKSNRIESNRKTYARKMKKFSFLLDEKVGRGQFKRAVSIVKIKVKNTREKSPRSYFYHHYEHTKHHCSHI